MSTNSYNDPCPNCGEQMTCYEDNRPFLKVGGECPYCGFYYQTHCGQMELKELNDLRKDYRDNGDKSFKHLQKLPKCDLVLIY